MSNIRITKQFSFETGHALYGYDGKCRNVHGHSYKLSVTVIGTPISDSNNVKFGMVIDFGDLKRIVKSEIVDVFDHARTHGQTIGALPARACSEHKLFQLGNPSVAFARHHCTESGRATDAPRTRRSVSPWGAAPPPSPAWIVYCTLDIHIRLVMFEFGFC